MDLDTRSALTQKALQVAVSVCLLIVAHVLAKTASVTLTTARNVNNDPVNGKDRARARSSSALIFHTLGNLVYIGIMVVAVFISLKVVGIEATGIVALLGASGLAIGLALQGILGDIASAIIMAIMPTFTIGDIVSIATNYKAGLFQRGRVEDFTLSHTVLADTETGARMTIPNRVLMDTVVVNHTSQPYCYVTIDVPVSQQGKASLTKVIDFVSKFLQKGFDVHQVIVGVTSIKKGESVVQARCVVDSVDFLNAELTLRTALAVALDASGLLK